MARASVAFKYQEDYRKLMEVEEAGKNVKDKWTSKMTALDEKMERDYYDGKRYSWNGYDAHEIERYEAGEEAGKKYLKEQQLKKLEKKNNRAAGLIRDSVKHHFTI
ncbi:hypothetical protein L1987_81513 [Smallanthus sonchifolius]|uniref:Uncharacterized protein n=1 Tax=Smallanthus sonchifolius TaxID=185202 RepID=A0ACB8YRW1_9ASTR|nr:hypothetical protein L1987_81513 [Smallanthus sonchifolius]